MPTYVILLFDIVLLLPEHVDHYVVIDFMDIPTIELEIPELLPELSTLNTAGGCNDMGIF